MTVDLYDKRYYINRELSWLEFNQRCLDEAMNNKTPLLDRAKFLAICYNNLEEFMMIRMPVSSYRLRVRSRTIPITLRDQ